MDKKDSVKQILRVFLFVVMITAALCGLILPVQGAENAKEEDHGVHPEKVHTLYWSATLRRDLKSGKKVLAKAGSKVTVIHRRRGNNKKSRILAGKDKKAVNVPNSWLSFHKDLPTIQTEGDYNLETKEAFINKKAKVRRGEKYLIWVSLDKQRVNVFRSEKHRWKLCYVFKCSTGKVSTPTGDGWQKVDYKRTWVSGLHWFTEVVGGGMHKWPGKLNKKQYGKHVASAGCIRLKSSDAHKIYKMIPVGTRVLVY